MESLEKVMVSGQKMRFFIILKRKKFQCNSNNSRTNVAVDLRLSALERGHRRLSFHVKVNRLLTWTRDRLLSDILCKLQRHQKKIDFANFHRNRAIIDDFQFVYI